MEATCARVCKIETFGQDLNMGRSSLGRAWIVS